MKVKAKIKTYPDGSKKIYEYMLPYQKAINAEQFEKSLPRMKTEEQKKKDLEESRRSNLYKTKARIKDYILSNDFTHFITFTFATERNDDDRAFARMRNWLKDQQRKHGKFIYIVIPERHKTGEIHFHLVIGDYAGDLVDSGVKHGGNTVYNVVDWRHGYSTATEIRNKQKTASYMTKYIVKDMEKNVVGKGKKKYWSPQGLKKPVVEYFEDIPDMSNAELHFDGDTCKIYQLSK